MTKIYLSRNVSDVHIENPVNGSPLIFDGGLQKWMDSDFLLFGTAGCITRFEGADGKLLKFVYSDDVDIYFPNSMAFPADAAGFLKSDGAGTLSWDAGGAGVTGSGAAGKLAIWDDITELTYNDGLSWDDGNLSMSLIGVNRYSDDGELFLEPGTIKLAYYDDTLNPFIIGYRARGTSIAPGAVLTDDILMRFSAAGNYDGSNWSTGSRARMDFVAAEDWQDDEGTVYNGTKINLWITPTGGSATPQVIATIDSLGLYLARDTVAQDMYLAFQDSGVTEHYIESYYQLPTNYTYFIIQNSGRATVNAITEIETLADASSLANVELIAISDTATAQFTLHAFKFETPTTYASLDTEFRIARGLYVGSISITATDAGKITASSTINSKQETAAGIALDHNSATGNFTLSLSPVNLSGNRRIIFPNYDITFPTTSTSGYLLNDGAGNFTWTVVSGGIGSDHKLLSATHTDTLAGDVVRGDMIVGDSTPKWSKLTVGSAYAIITTDGSDITWSTFLLSGTAGGKTTFAVTSGKTLTLTATDTYNLTVEASSNVNQDLTTDASPTFNRGNFTSVHTTDIAVDHITEHVSAHNIMVDSKMCVNHIGENTALHETVFDDDIKSNHVDEVTVGHGVVCDGVTLKDGNALIITGGVNTFNITNATASLDVAASCTVDINDNLTITHALTSQGADGILSWSGAYTLTIPATGTAALLGTAQTFTAAQKINVSSTTALFVEDDGTKDNVFIVDTANARVGINVAPSAGLEVATNVETLARGFNVYQYSATLGYGASIRMYRSKHATIGSHTAVINNETLGNVSGWGSDGTTFRNFNYIIFKVDDTGTISASSAPGKVAIGTTPDGSLTVVEHLTMYNAGNVTINNNATYGLLVENTGVRSNVLVVDTATSRIGINTVPITTLNIASNVDTTTRGVLLEQYHTTVAAGMLVRMARSRTTSSGVQACM